MHRLPGNGEVHQLLLRDAIAVGQRAAPHRNGRKAAAAVEPLRFHRSLRGVERARVDLPGQAELTPPQRRPCVKRRHGHQDTGTCGADGAAPDTWKLSEL
jgi:hypothetical protein